MSRAHFVLGPLHGPQPSHDKDKLSDNVGRQLDAVTQLFAQWNAEAAAQRQQALASRSFAPSSFEQALLVFNKRGECRRGTRVAQDWYFSARRQTREVSGQPCARCCVSVTRREVYFVDAAKEWHKADELCRACMSCVMRRLLGEDEEAILEEARSILDSGWSPIINSRLADALLGDAPRTFFASG